MDKLTESLASLSPGPCHNCRLGRRVVFHVIRECLCFCPLGTKRRKRFFKNWMPNIIHQGILLNYLQNNLQDGHFIIKIFLVRADFERWHFENYVVGLTSSSSEMVTTSPPPTVFHIINSGAHCFFLPRH